MKATKTMWKVHIGRLPFVIPILQNVNIFNRDFQGVQRYNRKAEMEIRIYSCVYIEN